jgi:hypothetical protein
VLRGRSSARRGGGRDVTGRVRRSGRGCGRCRGASAGVEDPVELVRVESLADAEQHRFLGTDYGLKCRLYRTEGAQQPLPCDEWVLAAIERARPAAGAER